MAIDRTNWWRTVREGVVRGEERRTEQRECEERRELKKGCAAGEDPVGVTDWDCDECGRYLRKKIGLNVHKKRKLATSELCSVCALQLRLGG